VPITCLAKSRNGPKIPVSCHFLGRQILDWVRVRVRVRVAVQELTVQDRTVQEPSGSQNTMFFDLD